MSTICFVIVAFSAAPVKDGPGRLISQHLAEPNALRCSKYGAPQAGETISSQAGFRLAMNETDPPNRPISGHSGSKIIPEMDTVSPARPNDAQDASRLLVPGRNCWRIERANRLAEDETKAVEGAEGSIAASADAQQLVSEGVSRFGPGGIGGAIGGSLFSEPLGAFTGSVAADTDGLTGRLELTFD